MKPAKIFNDILAGGYNRTWLGAEWKKVDGWLLFQQSKGKQDWFFNLLSAIKIPGKLNGKKFIFPLGFWCLWKTLEKVIRTETFIALGGYSQGGPYASYGSALTGLPAVTFGCPGIGIGDADLFKNVTHYKTPTDIVYELPPWAEHYGKTIVLQGEFIPKPGMSVAEYAEMLTGHTPKEYRQRLKNE